MKKHGDTISLTVSEARSLMRAGLAWRQLCRRHGETTMDAHLDAVAAEDGPEAAEEEASWDAVVRELERLVAL